MNWHTFIKVTEIVVLVLFLIFAIINFYHDLKASDWAFPNDRILLNYLVNTEFDYPPNGGMLIIRGTVGGVSWNNPSPFSVFFIQGLGYIPRWYKSHRYLKKVRKGFLKAKGETEIKPYKRIFGK